MLYLMKSAIFLYESSKTKHLNAYQAVWFNLTAKRCRIHIGLIHRSEWKRHSANFSFIGFSEVRNARATPSNSKDTRFGGYADAPAPGHVRGYIGTGRGVFTPSFLRPTTERVVLMRRNVGALTVVALMMVMHGEGLR
jgi:hypothetical protein